MSILVHPDKNQGRIYFSDLDYFIQRHNKIPGDLERAETAFDAVKRAWTLLEEKETRKECLEVVEEAKGRTNINMEEKRRKLRKWEQEKVVSHKNKCFYFQGGKTTSNRGGQSSFVQKGGWNTYNETVC